MKKSAKSAAKNHRNAAPSKALKTFGQPLDYPYLLGAYLALNALPDAALLVDGPDCAVGKAEHIFGKHDWRSTLLDCSGRHRVRCTYTDVVNAALSREAVIEEALLSLARRGETAAVLLSALPLASVTSTDYARVRRAAARHTKKPLLEVPARSLQGGYLEGYSSSLESLARGIDLPAPRGKAGNVALVGYFMDRNEEDHRANIRELRRLLEALGLNLISVWLDGSPYAELRAAGRAGTILSLPYGRQAAAVLARRTGARLIELGLPFGLAATRRWVQAVGRATRRTARAKRLIEAELAQVAGNLEWVVAHSFLNRRFWIAADPHLLAAVSELLEELGGRIAGTVAVGAGGGARSRAVPALRRPTSGILNAELARAGREGVDLFIGPTDVTQRVPRGFATAEFGFPSYFRHALSPSPFMGFAGALCFVDRLANAMSAHNAPRKSE